MKKFAIIVAGGEGTRLGGGLPKQFRDLCGRPMLWWSMLAFKKEDPTTTLILVLHKNHVADWDSVMNTLPEEDRIKYMVTVGGKSRTESVRNGLSMIDSCDGDLVAVHDAARPVVSPDMIRRGWESALKYKATVPVVAVTDSLRKLSEDGSNAVKRSEYVAVQTPQVFDASILRNAYEDTDDGIFTDDASVVEAKGIKIGMYEGDPHNIKVTNPGDIEIAGLLLKNA